jgi:hypothetical protein
MPVLTGLVVPVMRGRPVALVAPVVTVGRVAPRVSRVLAVMAASVAQEVRAAAGSIAVVIWVFPVVRVVWVVPGVLVVPRAVLVAGRALRSPVMSGSVVRAVGVVPVVLVGRVAWVWVVVVMSGRPVVLVVLVVTGASAVSRVRRARVVMAAPGVLVVRARSVSVTPLMNR